MAGVLLDGLSSLSLAAMSVNKPPLLLMLLLLLLLSVPTDGRRVGLQTPPLAACRALVSVFLRLLADYGSRPAPPSTTTETVPFREVHGVERDSRKLTGCWR